MKTVQLSVSSAILVSVLSGCSQQQAIGGSQLTSQQLPGDTAKLSPNDFYESEAHRKERLSLTGVSASQVKPSVAPIKVVYKPNAHKVKTLIRKKPRHTHSVSNTQKAPVSKSGQCFAKVKLSAKYTTRTKRVLIQKASAKRVLVRAPQYRWINKNVLVRKASYKTRTMPALYKTIAKRKVAKPAHYTWKKGAGNKTYRVKVPAVYKTINKRVQIRPAQAIRTYIPAVHKTIKQKQRISSAIYKTVKTPARYKTQNYRVKTSSARYVWKTAQCKTNATKEHLKQTKASANKYQTAKLKGRPIVRTSPVKQYKKSGNNYQHYLQNSSLDTDTGYYKIPNQKVKIKSKKKSKSKSIKSKKYNVTKILKSKKKTQAAKKRSIVYGIQKSLKQKGFDPGKLDGVMGSWTTAALRAFQSSNGLSVGVLNKETFAALGMMRS